MPGAKNLSSGEIAEIAHELRSPLGGIEAMIEMLAATALDANQVGIVAALRASVAHLRGIANGVLDGPEPVLAAQERQQLRLDDVLEVFDVACRARSLNRNVSFCLDGVDEVVGSVVVDAGPLRQVLENLADNAFRHMEAGKITLKVTRKPGRRIGFCLSDEGPGLSKADAARLISTGGGLEGRVGGAGIGLTIAGRLIEERGGILVGGPSETGVGAAFTFDWPDEHASEKGDCLIVDDHPASRLVLKTILSSAGYGCIEAAGVEEALAHIAAHKPEFVLTDINMPGKDGTVLIAEINALPEHARPKVLVVSADEINANHPVHALVDGSIQKPITVRAVLKAMLDLKRLAANCAA